MKGFFDKGFFRGLFYYAVERVIIYYLSTVPEITESSENAEINRHGYRPLEYYINYALPVLYFLISGRYALVAGLF